MLRGRRFSTVTPGVFRVADTPVTLELSITAAMLVLPDDAAVSHTTNLALRGLDMRPPYPLHFAISSDVRTYRDGIRLHRHRRSIPVETVGGFAALTPARTFVDCGTLLSTVELIEVGDWMVARGLVDVMELNVFAMESHLDGVRRARRAVAHVRTGSESIRESRLRWILVSAGLPEPELNVEIRNDRGTFLARGDLVYRERKVLVEYDGWHHERDAWQRQRDVLRREALEAAGWRVIVVTTADMRDPGGVVARVASALQIW